MQRVTQRAVHRRTPGLLTLRRSEWRDIAKKCSNLPYQSPRPQKNDTVAMARISAGGITISPSLKNRSALISWPSRRRATSHKIVASDPVIERYWPEIDADEHRARHRRRKMIDGIADQAMRPTGRLFMTLQARASIVPTASVIAGEPLAARRTLVSSPIAPALSIASTSTNSPATSGNTSQEIPRTMVRGLRCDTAKTMQAVAQPAISVGKPSGKPNAEHASKAAPVQTMPDP